MFKNFKYLAAGCACVCLSAAVFTASSAMALPDLGQTNAEVPRSNPQISGWATTVVDWQVGPMDYADPGLGQAAFGLPSDVLGDMGSPFSLGDGGYITLGFDGHIADGPDEDFVVFENAFEFGGTVFAELAFVEVSSDGMTFARMPAISRVNRVLGAWDGITPDEVYNLAGNSVGGTAFDLADLASDPLVLGGQVDLGQIRYVRIVDVIGDYAGMATLDSNGNPVSDPYPTAFASGGFDLTGVAIMNPPGAVPATPRSLSAFKSLYDR
ncbi:hypothetical protein DRQ53_08665 [bacterium]|nr:MAG: hypothetical protein DRQ32_05885 [bacterium]RKZ15571.1 MAG: hypothetical protein DRQ53_08665 [bacterium]